MHHLFLSDGFDACLLDILQLDTLGTTEQTLVAEAPNHYVDEPLKNIVQPLTCLSRLRVDLLKKWFQCCLDPDTDSAKMRPVTGVMQLSAIIAIAAVAIIERFYKEFHVIANKESVGKMVLLKGIVGCEMQRRNVCWKTVIVAISHSLQPLNIIHNACTTMQWIVIVTCSTMPKLLYKELQYCIQSGLWLCRGHNSVAPVCICNICSFFGLIRRINRQPFTRINSINAWRDE